MTAKQFIITSADPLKYELIDDSADLGTWLRSCYSFPGAYVTGELSDDDRQIYEAAYVAYGFGDQYSEKLVHQGTKEFQQSDLGKGGREFEAQFGFYPFAKRKPGRPVQRNDRQLIRAVEIKWRERDREVRLPASDTIDNSDRPRDFSRDCERFIRMIDPDRKRMPGRKTYEAALPEYCKSHR